MRNTLNILRTHIYSRQLLNIFLALTKWSQRTDSCHHPSYPRAEACPFDIQFSIPGATPALTVQIMVITSLKSHSPEHGQNLLCAVLHESTAMAIVAADASTMVSFARG